MEPVLTYAKSFRVLLYLMEYFLFATGYAKLSGTCGCGCSFYYSLGSDYLRNQLMTAHAITGIKVKVVLASPCTCMGLCSIYVRPFVFYRGATYCTEWGSWVIILLPVGFLSVSMTSLIQRATRTSFAIGRLLSC